MENEELRDKIIRVIDSGKQIYILSTVDEENRPHSRYMGTIDIADDYSVVYLACKSFSNKVRQIKANPNAQLLFVTPDYMEVASLSGKASFETSEEIKQETWEKNPPMAGYFNTLQDPELTIIRFDPEFAEYCSHANNYQPIRISWQAEPVTAHKKPARK